MVPSGAEWYVELFTRFLVRLSHVTVQTVVDDNPSPEGPEEEGRTVGSLQATPTSDLTRLLSVRGGRPLLPIGVLQGTVLSCMSPDRRLRSGDGGRVRSSSHFRLLPIVTRLSPESLVRGGWFWNRGGEVWRVGTSMDESIGRRVDA